MKTECCRFLKEYQTTCKANQKRFFQNQVNTLYSTDNSNLWKNWKNRVETNLEPKHLDSKMELFGKSTTKTFSGTTILSNNFVPKNDFQQKEVSISQKKLKYSDSARLISSTNKKELITVIKN